MYPLNVINATKTFLPRASSPWSVDGPSASTVPRLTVSPTFTIGLWCWQVPAFASSKFASVYSSFPVLFLTTMRLASTYSTIPSALDKTSAPESLAATNSTPVPTIGASAFNKGTDWRCMLAPIRARVASSCSRNGIQLVVTATTCCGDTST